MLSNNLQSVYFLVLDGGGLGGGGGREGRVHSFADTRQLLQK